MKLKIIPMHRALHRYIRAVRSLQNLAAKNRAQSISKRIIPTQRNIPLRNPLSPNSVKRTGPNGCTIQEIPLYRIKQ